LARPFIPFEIVATVFSASALISPRAGVDLGAQDGG
jgi:hypothetical protein